MSVTSEATATWSGSLPEGSGSVTAASGIGTFPINWKARSEGGEPTTTPEELIAAAHSSCFNMALSNELGQAGFTPDNVRTTASVTFVPGTGITGSHLNVSASIPEISEEKFEEIANGAKAGCPVSQALAGIEITIEASLA
ncbi:MAG: OsmC family peroxiredoxin [Candidatus Microbacterium stercoravium]|uniref:OsmC family peroxiredoxin n=1 Tax=Candidatus Microbacterium stercoravium TaxID=2838697 RepID=A0A9D2H5X2_9MICO|nr:OsmC family peroxiredoxin [Candidatus Microbacterium stercoravium]